MIIDKNLATWDYLLSALSLIYTWYLIGAVLELHKHGADINRLDDDKQSALLLAASNFHINCVKTLLKLGCNLQPIFKYGNDVINLQYSKSGRMVIATLLVAGCQPTRNKKAVEDIILSIIQELEMPDSNTRARYVKRSQSSLLYQSRTRIRKYLQFYNTKGNLFQKVEYLPLPKPLKRFLLYNLD